MITVGKLGIKVHAKELEVVYLWHTEPIKLDVWKIPWSSFVAYCQGLAFARFKGNAPRFAPRGDSIRVLQSLVGL